jgi:hypothetical protein
MKRDERPIDVAVFEPAGAGVVGRLLAGLGIEASAAGDLARRAPDERVIVCLDNPLVTARSRAADEGMSIRDACGEWESQYRELQARTPRHRRLVVHYDSLRHDAPAEVGRLATWLGVRVSRELLAAAAAEVMGRLPTQRATAEELIASGTSESVIGLCLDLCAEAGPVYHRALVAEVCHEQVGVLGPTQRDGHRSELGVAELMARLQEELTER